MEFQTSDFDKDFDISVEEGVSS